MLVIFAATPYMIWRTAKQGRKSQSLRYGVSGAVVTWTAIEIAAAMKFFNEPWLDTSLSSGVILLGLTVVLTALVFISFRAGVQSMVVPRWARIAVSGLIVSVIGCSPSIQSEPMTASRIRQQIDEYDGRIRRPNSAMTDGLLHALCSNDPEMRAQAAIAFGKSRRVNRVVQQRLEAIALTDESRLSQCAALIALSRLKVFSPNVKRLVNDMRNDKDWTVVAEIIGN
jgi:hypothetical protein